MKNLKKCLKNNSGFSLLEIIVVLAIIMILTASATLSIAYVNNANVSKAANTLDAAINTAKSRSMAMGPDLGELILSTNNGKLYYRIGDTGERVMICNKEISVYTAVTSTYTMGNVGYGGAIDTTGSGDIAKIRFTTSGTVDEANCSGYFTKFRFERGKRNVEVILYKETGKHTVNMF